MVHVYMYINHFHTKSRGIVIAAEATQKQNSKQKVVHITTYGQFLQVSDSQLCDSNSNSLPKNDQHKTNNTCHTLGKITVHSMKRVIYLQ